ncbi:cyclase family protein [Streptomyces sp. NPDC051776]|uniref:cyclase family protein n=1 Tax=Streptomyces sp. NPDC051776 TaxID=3155414 RepID=UPI0034495565
MTAHATPADGPAASSAGGFDALFASLRQRAARQGADGPRGALAYIGRVEVLAAAAEVRMGRTVTLAAPMETRPGPDDPDPCRHEMTAWASQDTGRGLAFARDRFALNVHGDADSHLDALCHVIYDGTLHGGVPAATVTEDGAQELTVETARDGIAGRGVLLDIPRLRGVPWLEPGDHVTADELAAAEEAQGVRVGRGDILLVRTGHRKRRSELGPWAGTRAGLHPGAAEFVAERRVAVLGSDSNSDVAPGLVRDVGYPVHVLAVHALGVHLLDYLQFEDLIPLCEEERRWSFFCLVAPLRLPGGTGSPVNPIAIL